jgi:hypothetical protein
VEDQRVAMARVANHQTVTLCQQYNEARELRNELIRELRTENPRTWTYAALAEAVDCTPELVAAIIQGRT